MSKHSHISAIFDNAFQSRAGSPDVYMSMGKPLLGQRLLADWNRVGFVLHFEYIS